MSRKSPHLQVIAGALDEAHATADATVFRIVALSELSSADQGLIKRLVKKVAPKAGLLGVMYGMQPWDIRPVLLAAGEKQPSVVRIVGAGSADRQLEDRISDILNRVKGHRDLNSVILDYGIFENRVWYRRKLVDFTLDRVLKEAPRIKLSQAELLSRNLVRQLGNWHAAGLVHGHICPSNVAVLAKGDVTFLDTGVAANVVQCGGRDSGANLDSNSFAPEILSNRAILFSTDLYGLGVVLKAIFAAVGKRGEGSPLSNEETSRLNRYQQICGSLLNAEVRRRPRFEKIEQLFLNSSGIVHKEKAKVREEKGGTQSIPRGKIVTRGGLKPKKQKQNSIAETATESSENQAESALLNEDTEVQPTKPSEKPDLLLQEENNDQSIGLKQEEAANEIFDEVDNPEPKVDRASAESPERIHTVKSQTTSISGSEVDEYQENTGDNYSNFKPDNVSEVKASHSFDHLGQLILKASVILIFVACIYMGFERFRGGEEPVSKSHLSDAQLSEYWNGRQVSLMEKVVSVAIFGKAESREYAETLIVGSALRGEPLPPEIKVPFLRVVFDSRWERQITREERVFALSLALSSFLNRQEISAIKIPEKLHPGLLLAMLSTNTGSRFLAGRSINGLFGLPPGLSKGFMVLAQDPRVRFLENPEVHYLAKLSVRGLQHGGFKAAEDLLNFLSVNTLLRLKAVAWVLSDREHEAHAFLSIVLEHPNLRPAHKVFAWAKLFELNKWPYDSVGKMFILSGIVPGEEISAKNMLSIFAHPDPAFRAFALEQALNTVTFKHSGSVSLLQFLRKEPDLLNGKQTMRLGDILSHPATVKEGVVIRWLESEPPLKIVAMLLEATASEKQATRVDFLFAQYLENNGWKGTLDELEILSRHIDSFTRIFAYNKLMQFEPKPRVLSILRNAYQHETNSEFRQLLEENIHKLSTDISE